LEQYGSFYFIEELVSGGTKSYAFSAFCPLTGKRATKSMVNGINLNYENSMVVNIATLRNMILEIAPPVHVNNTRKIKRKRGGVVVSEPENIQYQVVFKKRRLTGKFYYTPYGY